MTDNLSFEKDISNGHRVVRTLNSWEQEGLCGTCSALWCLCLLVSVLSMAHVIVFVWELVTKVACRATSDQWVTVCVLIRFLDAFCVPVYVGWSVLSVAASSFRKSFEGITESPILQMDRYTGALHIENICWVSLAYEVAWTKRLMPPCSVLSTHSYSEWN